VESDPARIPFYMAASTLLLAGVIVFAGRLHAGSAPRWIWALAVALIVSVIGILFAKYGANFGLPWWVYYTAPMLATLLIPPLAFRFPLWRALIYVLLAFATAPLIHAVFFYSLGWADYMPFLALPALQK
jgi:hypothetical protein